MLSIGIEHRSQSDHLAGKLHKRIKVTDAARQLMIDASGIGLVEDGDAVGRELQCVGADGNSVIGHGVLLCPG